MLGIFSVTMHINGCFYFCLCKTVQRHGKPSMRCWDMDSRGVYMYYNQEQISISLLHGESLVWFDKYYQTSTVSVTVFALHENNNDNWFVLQCRSWKTFMTIMHWPLQHRSSWVQLSGHQGMCIAVIMYCTFLLSF